MAHTTGSSNLLWPKANSLAMMLCLLLPLFSAGRAHAQAAGTGTIQGTVQDSSGANISGATVTATNNGTGLKSTQRTSSAGTYVLSALPPGDYNLEVSMPGSHLTSRST